MKKLVLFAAVAAFSIPAQSFAAHHARHHGAWKAHHCKHAARHCSMQRRMSGSNSSTTEALNARSFEQARGTMTSTMTAPPVAPAVTATAPVATQTKTLTAPVMTTTTPVMTTTSAPVVTTTTPVVAAPPPPAMR